MSGVARAFIKNVHGKVRDHSTRIEIFSESHLGVPFEWGPLGEGKIVDGCITCPWHGFQYRPQDGCTCDGVRGLGCGDGRFEGGGLMAEDFTIVEKLALALVVFILGFAVVLLATRECDASGCFGGPCMTSAACVSGCHCIGGRCG